MWGGEDDVGGRRYFSQPEDVEEPAAMATPCHAICAAAEDEEDGRKWEGAHTESRVRTNESTSMLNVAPSAFFARAIVKIWTWWRWLVLLSLVVMALESGEVVQRFEKDFGVRGGGRGLGRVLEGRAWVV